jgi:hypothetical protein
MLTIGRCSWILLIGLTVAAPAAAQSIAVRNVTAEVNADCRVFSEVKYSEATKAEADSQNPEVKGQRLRTCVQRIEENANAIRNQLLGEAPSTPANLWVSVDGVNTAIPLHTLNGFLIKQHLVYKSLKRWVSAYRASLSTADPTSLKASLALSAAVEEADDAIHEALKMRGLNELFSAALMSGAVIATGASEASSADGERAGQALAHVAWESKHFGDDSDLPFDFSFGGKFGFLPALNFVETAPADDESGSDSETAYQEAFVWDLAGKVNMKLFGGNAAELSAVARAGQVMLGTQSVLLDRGANSVLALPVADQASTTEWFYDFGLQYQLYNNPLDVVHGEGTMVSPMFSIGLFYRRDQRFKKEGSLAAFDHPSRRLVFRFMIDALKVMDRRELAETPRTFTIGFGVEHEAPIGSGDAQVPSGTKIIFKGDIDLLRAFRGRST